MAIHHRSPGSRDFLFLPSLDRGDRAQWHLDLLLVLIHEPVLLPAAEDPEAVPHGGVRLRRSKET